MTRNVNGLNPLAYQGVNASNPPNMIILKRAPTASDTKNVRIGDFWLDSVTDTLYQLVSLANDVAAWNEVATPAGVGTSFFDTDAGIAQDLNQRIAIAGGSNINTAGAGNTVTFNLDDTVTILGTFTTTSGNIDVLAGRMTLTRTGVNEGQIIINSTTVDTISGTIAFIKDRNLNAINPGDDLGVVSFDGYDAPLSEVTAAKITATCPTGTTVAANRVAGQLSFFTHPDSTGALEERMVIAHNGLIVMSSSTTTDTLIVEKPTGGNAAISAVTFENNANPVVIRTAKNRAAAAVQPGDGLGVVAFDGYDGGLTIPGAYIAASIPALGTVAPGRMPTDLGIFTAPDAVSAPLARLIIYSDGKGQINFPDTAFTPGDDFATWTVYGTRALSGIAAGYANTQWVEGQQSVQTTNAAIIPILEIPVAEGQMVLIKGHVSGFRSTFAAAAVAEVFFGVYRPTAGNVTLIGAPAPVVYATATQNVTNTVDIGTQTARINVIGIAAQTHNWVCKYSYMYLIDNN